jgi:hypothetical protein
MKYIKYMASRFHLFTEHIIHKANKFSIVQVNLYKMHIAQCQVNINML